MQTKKLSASSFARSILPELPGDPSQCGKCSNVPSALPVLHTLHQRGPSLTPRQHEYHRSIARYPGPLHSHLMLLHCTPRLSLQPYQKNNADGSADRLLLVPFPLEYYPLTKCLDLLRSEHCRSTGMVLLVASERIPGITSTLRELSGLVPKT